MDTNNFIFIQPKRNRPTSARARETVRVVFAKNKRNSEGCIMTIYLGKELAKKININASDKVAVGYDKENSRKILLKKSATGYTATEISGKDTPSFRISLQWQIFVPTDTDVLLKEVRHKIVDDVLLIEID